MDVFMAILEANREGDEEEEEEEDGAEDARTGALNAYVAYQCANGCGFTGRYRVVEKHELTCNSLLTPTA